jgi:hypothetical protein
MNVQSSGPAPILCAQLLSRVDEKLVDLLGSLEASEWDLQTIAPLWKVRDVAAHLLDTALRKLSIVRDSCYVEAVSVRSPQDVITLVNRLNGPRTDGTLASPAANSSRHQSAWHYDAGTVSPGP